MLHSKGPWYFDQDGSTLKDSYGNKLLEIHDLQFDADANLIESAPELWDLCVKTVKVCRQFGAGPAPTPDMQNLVSEIVKTLATINADVTV